MSAQQHAGSQHTDEGLGGGFRFVTEVLYLITFGGVCTSDMAGQHRAYRMFPAGDRHFPPFAVMSRHLWKTSKFLCVFLTVIHRRAPSFPVVYCHV